MLKLSREQIVSGLVNWTTHIFVIFWLKVFCGKGLAVRGFGILISAGMIACATMASAELRQVGPTSASVIDGPGTVYRFVTRLSQGTRVNVVERYNGYALIKLRDGRTAWMKDSALVAPGTKIVSATKPKKPSQPIKTEIFDPYTSVVWTKSDPLNMRKGPGTSHAIMGKCQRGDWVKVLRKTGTWAEIELDDGKQGWVHTAYLTR